jgi:hypothetical protein
MPGLYLPLPLPFSQIDIHTPTAFVCSILTDFEAQNIQ